MHPLPVCDQLRLVASPWVLKCWRGDREALGVQINEFYGHTECNMTVSSCGADFPVKAGCIGKPVTGHDVQVIDA